MEEDLEADMIADENSNRIVESPLYSSITEDESPNGPEYPTQSGSTSTSRVYRRLGTPSLEKIIRIKPFRYDNRNNCFVYRVSPQLRTNRKKSRIVFPERLVINRQRRRPAKKRNAAPRPEGQPLITGAAPKSPESVISIDSNVSRASTGPSETDLKDLCCCDVDKILNLVIIENIAIEASILKQNNDEKSSEQADTENLDPELVDPEKVDSELVDSEQVDAEFVDPEKDSTEKADPEEVDPEKVDSEELESEQVDLEKVDSEKVESEKVESEKVDSDNVESEKVDSENVDSEKVESEKVVAEKVDSESQTDKNMFTQFNSTVQLQTDLVVNNEENDFLLYIKENELTLLDLVKALKSYKDKKNDENKEMQSDVQRNRKKEIPGNQERDPTSQPSLMKSQSYAELYKISQYNKNTLLGYYEKARQVILGRKDDVETITTVSRQQEPELEQPRENQQENIDQNRSTLRQSDKASRITQHTERPVQNSQVPPSLISFQQKQLENQHRFHAQQMLSQQQLLYQQRMAPMQHSQQPQQRFVQPYLQQQQGLEPIRNVQQHWDRLPQTAPYSMPNTVHRSNIHGSSSRQPISRSQPYRYASDRSLYEMQQQEHQNLQRLTESSTIPTNANYYTRRNRQQ